MREANRSRVTICVVFSMFLLAVEGRAADILDRMMAVVDGRVVALSDVEEYRKLSELFGDSVSADDSIVLRQIIENMLIQDQIDQLAGIRVTQEEVSEELRQIGETGDLAVDVVREAARARLMRARYFSRRFSQQASDAEIAEYYETVFLPAAAVQDLDPIPPLEDVSELIRNNIITEKADREISVWVESLYGRSQVEVVD